MEAESNSYVLDIIENIKEYKHFRDTVYYNGIHFLLHIEEDALRIRADDLCDESDYACLFDEKFKNTELIDVIKVLQNMITKEGFIYSKMLDKIFKTEEDKIKAEDKIKCKNEFYKMESKNCSVCFDECYSQLRCDHNICRKCFKQLKKHICPICRIKIYKDEDEE
jgi:hypothetical protein